MKEKGEALKQLSKLCKEMQTLQNFPSVSIRSDHERQLAQLGFDSFSEIYCITHNFAAPRTPQQNGVVESKNRTLEEMARTMLIENGIPNTIRLKQLLQQIMRLIDLPFDPFYRKHPMSYLKEENQILHTLNHSIVSVLFITMVTIT